MMMAALVMMPVPMAVTMTVSVVAVPMAVMMVAATMVTVSTAMMMVLNLLNGQSRQAVQVDRLQRRGVCR